MKVVLDTSVLCQDFRMDGTNFRIFLDGLSVVPLQLNVPDIVIDEVVNRFTEDIESIASAGQKLTNDLARLLPAIKAQSFRYDCEEEAKNYRAWLVAKFQGLKAEIIPYPEIDHKLIVERDLARRRPFKRNGAGYRDTLIWQNIKRVVSLGNEKVVLLTGNTRDFGAGPAVDPDLASELLIPSSLEVMTSLRAFNDKYVVPKLTMLEEVRSSLLLGGPTAFNVSEWVHTGLLDLLKEAEIGWLLVGFPDNVGSVWPSRIVDLKVIEIDEVRELSSGERLVRLTCSLELEATVSVDWDDYVNHAEVRDWYGEAEEPFLSSWSHDLFDLTIEAELVVNAKTTELKSAKLRDAWGPFGSIEFG